MKNALKLAKLNPKISQEKAILAKRKVDKKYTWEARSKSLIFFINYTFK